MVNLVTRRHDTQHNDIQHNDDQHNDIQHNEYQYNEYQYNDNQHNDVQHNNKQKATLTIMKLSTVADHCYDYYLCRVSQEALYFHRHYAECHYVECRGANYSSYNKKMTSFRGKIIAQACHPTKK
jgi:hypothetical protein